MFIFLNENLEFICNRYKKYSILKNVKSFITNLLKIKNILK